MAIAIWSFILCLLAMTAVGALSYINKKKQTEDYLLASREVPAWLSALSAVSTNNSGFMFIGMIGYTYRLGIESIWLMIGWIAGDLCGWLFFYPRIRKRPHSPFTAAGKECGYWRRERSKRAASTCRQQCHLSHDKL